MDHNKSAFRIDVAAAVNDREILANCLHRSPDIVAGLATLRTYEGFSSAGAAYNQALSESQADYLVLVHQDVYLPRGYISRLESELEKLSALDPDWAVAGIVGLTKEGIVRGLAWSSGLSRLVGERAEAPQLATTLDEVLVVVRRSAGLQFDPHLPSFHLYATDILQAGLQSGLNSYIIDAPAIHHSRPVTSLSGGYIDAYKYLQKKWKHHLPLPNLICPVQSSSRSLHWRNFRLRLRHLGSTKRAVPAEDPVAIAQRIGLEAD